LEWSSFVLEKEATTSKAWELADDSLEHLYQVLSAIPEANQAIVCIATLEVKEATQSLCRKRQRSEDQVKDSEDTLLHEYQQKTLEYGMPQIRFLLFCTTKDGSTRDWREIQKCILQQPCFASLHVSLVDPKNQSMSMEKALKKVLRVHAHAWSLNQFDSSISICTWYCYCSKSKEHVNTFLHTLMEKDLNIEEYFIDTTSSTQQHSSQPQDRLLDSVTHTKDGYEQFLLLIERLFKHYHLFFDGSKGHVYRRIPNTIASCEYQCTLHDFVSSWTSPEYTKQLVADGLLLRGEQEKGWRFQAIKYGSKFLKSIQDYYRDFLPSYHPNYDYVEFQGQLQLPCGECLTGISS
jgi:hypothetical protein